MTITIILAYFLIALFLVIERCLRIGKLALSLQPGIADAGSSLVLWISGVIGLLFLMIVPTLNTYQIGYWQNIYIGWIGVILMLGGILMRYWAAKTLGKFYTRTLQVIEGQEIVTQPPYNLIRHPGYLGTLAITIGAGLAVRNWMVLLIVLVVELLSKIYRINVEEKMLEAELGEQYQAYCNKTWKIIPYLY